MEKFEELDFETFKIKCFGEDLTEQINSVIEYIKNEKKLSGNYKNINYIVQNKMIQIFLKGNIFSIIKYPIKLKREGNDKDFYLYNYDCLYRDIKNLFNKYIIFYNDKEKPEENLEDLYLKLRDYEGKIDAKEERILILKTKIEVNTKFIHLCNRIDDNQFMQQKSFQIDYKILTPFFNEIFNFSTDDEKFDFILDDNRKSLFLYFNDFEKSENIKILKIYGNDGIGKSISLLYYTSLQNNKRFLYFNFKLIFPKLEESESHTKVEIYNYFKLELMRYFVIQYNIQEDDERKKTIKHNYQKYLEFLKKLEKNNTEDIKNFNFWNLFKYLINNLQNCIFILDQFKYEVDKLKNIDEIIHHIKNTNNNNKIIVSSSINDSGVKSKLVKELSKHCESIYPLMMNINNENKKKEGIKENKNGLDNINNIKEDEIEDDEEKKKSEKDYEIENKINNTLNIDEQNFYNEYYQNFLKINIFNSKISDTIRIKTKEKKEKKKSPEIINKINDDTNVKNDFINTLLKNQKNYISHSKYEVIEEKMELQIYINELINVQELVKNTPKEFKICMEYFNYLPKYYNKYIEIDRRLKIDNQNIDYNKITQIFYDEMKRKIIKKIHQSYKNLNKSDSTEALIYEYKSLFKLSLNITNQKYFGIKKLLKYIKQFPIKFLKIQIIYSSNIKGNEKLNFIDIDKEFDGEFFSFEYSYPFIEYVIKDYLDSTFNLINFDIINKDLLTGSAFGNFLERKFEYLLIEKNKFKMSPQRRYVWALEKLSESNLNNKKKEYFKNKDELSLYKQEKLDDIIIEKLDTNYKYHYIIPKKQINKYFDSALIIVFNKEERKCSLIVFQITKNKGEENIYAKEDYIREASNNTKPKLESIYGIDIIDIHFFYVLYNEDKNLGNLIIKLKNKTISFFSISLTDYEFYSENHKLLKDIPISYDSKIFNIDKEKEKVKFLIKKNKFIRFELNYNSNKIDQEKNSYFAFEKKRRDVFKKENISLVLEDQYYHEIINYIKQYFIVGNYTIVYCFKIEIKYSYLALKDDDYVGIFVYKDNLYFFHKKEIRCLNGNIDKSKKKEMLLYLLDGEKLEKQKISKELSEKKIGLKSLIDNNIYSYSFIFKIYKINK